MIPIFVINLDRAPERWASVQEAATTSDVTITRIAAVDGGALPEGSDPIVDVDLFYKRNGRPALPGEIGVYLSQRKALSAFLETGASHGLIMEDDMLVSFESIERMDAIIEAVPNADIIKLVNHRANGFVGKVMSRANDHIGRALFGPQGSAAAYVVSRKGAERFLGSNTKMSLPYDVELERGWAHGLDLRCAKDNVFTFSEHRKQSFIAKRSDYKSAKANWFKRIPTALFRAQEHIRRFTYGCGLAIRPAHKR